MPSTVGIVASHFTKVLSNVDWLLVASGGGGGTGNSGSPAWRFGGGGGGGGARYSVSAVGAPFVENTIKLFSGVYTITVPGGGARNTNGSDASIIGPNVSLTSTGGGSGGSSSGSTIGGSGGCGGGGAASLEPLASRAGGATTDANQGFAGATGTRFSSDARGTAGGGGGNVQTPGTPTINGATGQGWIANTWETTDTLVSGGAGAGGTNNFSPYSRIGGSGICGGGNGGTTTTSGDANTGGGGGGGAADAVTTVNGSSGGSGVVYFRYLTSSASSFTITASGGTSSTIGSYTVWKFTASGSLTVA